VRRVVSIVMFRWHSVNSEFVETLDCGSAQEENQEFFGWTTRTDVYGGEDVLRSSGG